MYEYGSTAAVVAVRRAVAAISTTTAPNRRVLASVVAAALCLGLVWSPALSRHTTPGGIFYVTPWILWMYAGCLLVAALISGWLGAAIAYVAIRGWASGAETAAWTAVYFAVGALFLIALERCPRPVLRCGLLASAALSVAVSLVGPWPWGSYQNSAAQGAMLAMVLPLAPPLAMPLLAVGLLWSSSYLAWIAAGVGIAVAYPPSWRYVLPVVAAVVIGYPLLGIKSTNSIVSRWEMWTDGARHLLGSPWIGYGPGAWATHSVAPLQEEIRWAAHNEVLQWVYETGMAGAAILVGWLSQGFSRVRMAPPMWRGAAAAVLVCSLGLQVFHYPTLAPVALLVLGGALQGAR